MIKNINETLSLISLIVLTILAIRSGIGWAFYKQNNTSRKETLILLKNYEENEED